jgi:hypothetical protein
MIDRQLNYQINEMYFVDLEDNSRSNINLCNFNILISQRVGRGGLRHLYMFMMHYFFITYPKITMDALLQRSLQGGDHA